ncbi:oxidoreductase molybdopterin binding protein [Hyphomicrobium denitrificans 1NES1]|uniref:Oxidoreductase molybdopterin binding protein n=1 Tax=Hyphomicrobium denitrificans 1NES1 TaxID=670307 RepID=N0BC32_9HYPH|nr:sulfite dehydrogenase [Hyphomicrobium denitrificans]AGK58061.1 oxidoreductase molybdopterin binding protein [Hyphomicrobium denitrificans 1NES1]
MAGKFSDCDLTPIAGGGLLDRRLLLKSGVVFVAAASSPTCFAHAGTGDPQQDANWADPPWLHQTGGPFSGYGTPSKYEKYVVRNIGGNRAPAGDGVSWTPLEYLEGIVTPSGLHFERHHNGVPDIDPKQHRLVIHGRVRQALMFTVENLLRYPMRSQFLFIECGGNSNAGWHEEPIQRPVGSFHGLVSCSEWTGVPLSVLLDEAGVDPSASWVIAEGADANLLNVSLPLSKLMDDAIVALYQNGERLRPENGYPVRLVVPGWEGITNVKWLRRLHVTDQPAMTRNETAKYTELLPSGKARMFTFVMDAKSLITSPSPGQTLKGPNIYEIHGLAWSGRGKIAKVDVSADGGKSWAEALLDGPVMTRCFTRFRMPWKWNGEPAVLKSRATDETGYVQPERDVLIKERGRNGYFHYNAIASWAVDEDGEVRHVYS